MTRTLRIDSVTPVTGGTMLIGYTSSNSALQAGPAKTGKMFASKAAMIAALQGLETSITDEQLMLMLIATGYKTDNTLTTATLNSLVGHTIGMSLQSGAQLVTVV